jgi:ActR/RegA family two-component response regulator
MGREVSADILVVDDIEAAGQEYVRLIERETGLSAVFAQNAQDALDLLITNPIKVAVLDQIIGSDRGTELFLKIRDIDPTVRAVMFTGEAGTEDVANALRNGYGDYLTKMEVASLSRVVVEQLHEHKLRLAISLAQTNREVVLRRRHGVWPRVRSQSISLFSIAALETPNPRADWRARASVRAGEHKVVKDEYETSQSLTIDRESQSELSSTFGFSTRDIGELSVGLAGKVAEQLRLVVQSSATVRSSRERTLQLPAEPTDPRILHVIKRTFERAPISRTIRVTLMSECECCQGVVPLVLAMTVTTNTFHTRQIDVLSNGESVVTETGVEADDE